MTNNENEADERHRSEKIGDFVSIYHRGSVWWMNYQNLQGKQVRRSLKTHSKKQAKLMALKKEGELLQGADGDEGVIATVQGAIEKYESYLVAEGRAPKTLSKYRLTFKRIRRLAERREVKNMRGITLQFVDAFRKLMQKKGAAPKTIHNETTILRQLVNFALSRDMLDKDPLKALKLSRPKPTRQPFWTQEQVQQILKATADDSYGPVFKLLALTGMRIAEAKYAAWDDIDGNGRLHIREKVINEKNGEMWKPKNRDQRVIPLSAPAQEILAALPRRGRWVFASPASRDGDRPIDERRVLYHLKAALKKLGLPGHLHTFRHSFISHALLQGAPEAVVRKWVGHVDAEIMRLYTHIADQDSKAQMDKLFQAEPTVQETSNDAAGPEEPEASPQA